MWDGGVGGVAQLSAGVLAKRQECVCEQRDADAASAEERVAGIV